MEVIQSQGYSIYLENKEFNNLSHFLNTRNYKKIFVLCDDNTIRFCMPRIEPLLKKLNYSVILLRHGEEYKTMQNVEYIWAQLLKKGATRFDLLINLGGGVISDIGGFAATLYKRGIDFVNIPTTLLAQIDASVGGKNGIDWAGIKNMIGTFSNPNAVFIFNGFLYTLPEQELFSGGAEVLKHGLLSTKALWEKAQKLYFFYEHKQLAELNGLLLECITVKNDIVAQDWKDTGARQSLNLGHTVAHSLEAWALGKAYELKHGEAVILGLIAELNLSARLLNVDKNQIESILAVISSIYKKTVFWQKWATLKINIDELLVYLYADKKNESGQLLLPLWLDFGKIALAQQVDKTQIEWAFGRLAIELRQF